MAAWAGVTRVLLLMLGIIENYFFLVLPGSLWLLDRKGKAKELKEKTKDVAKAAEQYMPGHGSASGGQAVGV